MLRSDARCFQMQIVTMALIWSSRGKKIFLKKYFHLVLILLDVYVLSLSYRKQPRYYTLDPISFKQGKQLEIRKKKPRQFWWLFANF